MPVAFAARSVAVEGLRLRRCTLRSLSSVLRGATRLLSYRVALWHVADVPGSLPGRGAAPHQSDQASKPLDLQTSETAPAGKTDPTGGNQSPRSVEKRLRSLKELTLDAPFSPLDTTVVGLYRHVYGHSPRKDIFDIHDPDEFLRVYGDFVYLGKAQYERRLSTLTEPRRLLLQAAIRANHNSCTSAAKLYWRFLCARKRTDA